MSFHWTQTNTILDGFFKLLACEKCNKTPEKPIRFAMCGHMFCDTCCMENPSACMKCNMPVSPNEMQPHHLVAQLISYCQTIKEAIRETNVEDKETDRPRPGTELAAKNIARYIASINNGGNERDLDSDTPGYRDPTQKTSRLEGHELDWETPGYRDPTQMSRSLKEIETESETPGYRDPTQMCDSLKENEAESETPGYRDTTQIPQHEKQNELKEKISKILARDSKELQSRRIDAMDVVREDDHGHSDILVPETVEIEGISVVNNDQANTVIAESMETAEEEPDYDTVSVRNMPQDWTQEFGKMCKETPKSGNTLSSGNFEINAAESSEALMYNHEAKKSREPRRVTEDLEINRHDLDNTVRGNSQVNLNEFVMETKRIKVREEPKTMGWDGDAANAKIIASETSETAENDETAVKKPQLKNVDSLHRKNRAKEATKTTEQSKRRPRTNVKLSIPKTLPKNVNKRNAKGESILHTACVKGQDDYVKALLEAGANPNTKDHANWTPLQEAVNLGHSEICKMLLESGASPNTPGMENRTALHDATIGDKLEEAALLLRFNANKDVYDKFGKRPIDYVTSDEMRTLLTDNSDIEKVAIVEAPSLNTTLDHSILTPNAKVVVLPSNLSSENKKLLMQIAPKLKVAVATTFRPGVTHVVVEANERNITKLTYNVMLAILEGKWILNSQWIAISTDLNDISEIDLEIFQVHGAPNPGTPERSRLNEEKQNPRLFNNCFFYFTIGVRASWNYGKLEFTKQNLTNLVITGEGEILNREPDPEDVKDYRLTPFHVAHRPLHPLHRCSHFIIYMPGKDEPRIKYNMPHIKTLPLAWFFECIEKFELVDPILMGIS